MKLIGLWNLNFKRYRVFGNVFCIMHNIFKTDKGFHEFNTDKVKDMPAWWTEKCYHELASYLFEEGCQSIFTNRFETIVKFNSLTAGRSSTKVLQVTFEKGKQQKGFIVRIPQTKEDAEKEAKKISHLNVDDSICFATFFGKYSLCKNHLVIIYKDVLNIWNEEIYDLSKYLSISTDKGDIDFFIKHFQNCMKYAMEVYRLANLSEVEHPRDGNRINVSEHYNNVRLDLPPDLIIVEPKFVLPPNGNELSDISFDELKKWDDRECGQKLVKFKETLTLEYKKPISGEDNAAYMVSKVTNGNENLIIWLKIAKDKCYRQSEIDKLNFLENDMVTSVQRLKEIKFNAKACISNTELKKVLSSKEEAIINTRRCHYDFHCGNVLVSNHYSVFIDLVDADFDLDASDIARLHVASWYELSRELKISNEDAEQILYKEPNLLSSPSNSFAIFHYFSHKLEKILKNFIEKEFISSNSFATSLAYVIQILMFQRYSILDGRESVPTGFSEFSSHWIRRLCNLCATGKHATIMLVCTNPNGELFNKTVLSIVTNASNNIGFCVSHSIGFDAKTIEEIKKTQEQNVIVVIVIDIQNSFQVKKVNNILNKMSNDEHEYYNCILLIVSESNSENAELQSTQICQYVKSNIASEYELEATLIAAIPEVNSEIKKNSKRVTEGKGPKEKPNIIKTIKDFLHLESGCKRITSRKNISKSTL